jgi:uncharacterized RDD family membrane protein YckC
VYCSRCGTWTPDSASTCARCGEALAPPGPVHEPAPATPAPVEPVQAAPVPAPPAPHYAGFWRRFAAMFVDCLLLFFPDAILRVMLGLPTPFSNHTLRQDEMSRFVFAIAVSTATWWLYCALLESSAWRGTLGQQLLGMRVGDREGRRISFGRATGRYFAQWISALLCGIGYLFNLWTQRRQTLHDLVAGCVLTVPGAEAVPAGVIVAGRSS